MICTDNEDLTTLAQKELLRLKLYRGIVDGKWGPRSEEAFRAYVHLAGGSPFEEEPVVSEAGRTINADGLALVKHFEGLYLSAYKDPVGIWTIGYGHTGLQHKDGTVYAGRKVTEAEAESLLRYDMRQFEARVAALVRHTPLTDDEFSALVSFDFNTGGLHRSTLLQKLTTGDTAGAANEFLRWNRAGGKVLAGLTRRRKSERNLFLSVRPHIVA